MANDFPYHLTAGETFTMHFGGKSYGATAKRSTLLRDEADAKAFVSGYSFPHTTVPGEKIQLLGREVVIAIEKTFDDYDEMEWWCSIADGIPELGLYDHAV